MQKLCIVIFIVALSAPHFCFNGGPGDVREDRAKIEERQRAEEARKAEEQRRHQDQLWQDFEKTLEHQKKFNESPLSAQNVIQTKSVLQEMTPDRAAKGIMKIVKQLKSLTKTDADIITDFIKDIFTVKNSQDQKEVSELFTGLNALHEGLAREPKLIKIIENQSKELLSKTFENAHTFDGATLKTLLLNLVKNSASFVLGEGMAPRDIFLGLLGQASPKTLGDAFKDNQQLSDYFFESIKEVQKSITEIQQGRRLSEYDNRRIAFAMTALENVRSFYTDQKK